MKKLPVNTYTQKDWLVMVLVIPFMLGMVNYLALGNLYIQDIGLFLTATLLGGIAVTISFVFCGTVAVTLRERMPSYKKTLNRIIIALAIFFTATFLINTLLVFIYQQLSWLTDIPNNGRFWDSKGLWHVIIFGCLCNLVLTLMMEAIYVAENWQKSLQEAEQLKKVNLQSQFESLKSQVNPHFLFNSLNSLSSLISDNPEQAEAFLDEMSKVYRYLLRNNENDLTELALELQFIRSYFHLLKTRYGDGIMLDVQVDAQHELYLLPPLTLQLLVENAVKHNVIMKEEPLKIQISSNGKAWLTVRNNSQKKTIKVQSNKVGLANIVTKYQLMNQPDVLIQEEAGYFQVTIPLIKNTNS